MTKENKWFIVLMISFTIGIIVGGMYCAFLDDGAELYKYLHSFIETIKNGIDKTGIFGKSLVNGIKLIIVFLICSMIKFGFIPICITETIKGFSVGFTFSSLFKYFGENGVLLILSQIPSTVILFVSTVFFGAVCSKMSVIKKNKDTIVALGISFLIMMICILIYSLVSGYIDTYIMEFIAVKLY